MRQIVLQNTTAILLQKAKKIYYKMHQVLYCKTKRFHYKMRPLLQNAIALLSNATITTKCDIYYQMRRYRVKLIWRYGSKISQTLSLTFINLSKIFFISKCD